MNLSDAKDNAIQCLIREKYELKKLNEAQAIVIEAVRTWMVSPGIPKDIPEPEDAKGTKDYEDAVVAEENLIDAFDRYEILTRPQ